MSPASASTVPMNQRAIALEVWVASLDPQSIALLEDLGSAQSTLQSLFTGTPPEDWRNQADQQGGLPPRVKSSLRILNKTLPLP